MNWRAQADQVIWEVHASLDEEATLQQVRKALRAAYPFGERRMYPYRVWCKRQQRYLSRRFSGYVSPGPKRLTHAQKLEAMGQLRLFDGETLEVLT